MTKLRSVAIVYPYALPSSGFTGKGPTETLLVTGIISIIVGIIMLIASILSIVCLRCIKVRYYKFFFFIGPVLLIILFLILIGFALFIIITGDTELQRLAASTQTTVYYYYNSTSTTLVRDGWDFVQYYFNCCGVKTNNTDWYPAPSTGWVYNSQLPRSCCGSDSNDIGHAGRIFVATSVPTLTGFCYYGDIGKPTCYDSIKTNLLITVLVFLIATALIVLVLAILSIILLLTYRTIHQRVENSIEK
jgi:energy-coupling factor transporter transmembrane protein EcfT